MKNLRIVLGAAVILALVAAALLFWIPRHSSKSADGSAPVQIKVAQVGDFFIYMPLYYAIDRGYFARHGLAVTLIPSGGDDKSVAAILSGSADFGVGDPTFAAMAREHGQDVRVVASVVNGVPFWGVAQSPKIKPITDASGLRGLVVATFPKPSTAYTLQAQMFKSYGLTPNIREVQFGSLLPLLQNRSVDVVLELEPNVSTAVANGAHVVYSMADRYPDFAITGVTVTGKTVASRPEVVANFIAALDDAEKAAHANPADVTADAKMRFPNVPPAIAEAAIRRMLDSGVFPAKAAVTDTAWAKAISLRVESGDLKSAQSGQGVVYNPDSRP